MKSPPKQIRDDEARELTERFIAQNRGAHEAEGRREEPDAWRPRLGPSGL